MMRAPKPALESALPPASTPPGASSVGVARAGLGHRSLQARLIIRLCIVFITFFLLAGISTYYFYRSTGTDIPYEFLDNDMSVLKNALSHNPDGSWSVDPHKLSSDLIFFVRRADGTLLLSGGDHTGDPEPIGPLAVDESALTWQPIQGQQDQGALGYSLTRAVSIDGETIVLHVARRITPTAFAIDAIMTEWLGEYLPLSFPMLGGLLVALVFTLQRALRPLDQLMRSARAINPARTGLRLPTDGLPAELLGPVDAINGALDRLDRGFQAQRNFLADAAHELRTPLAILGAHLDSLPDKNAAAGLRADIDRMSRLVSQLLMVAQLEALTIDPEESADLSAVAQEIATLIAPLAYRRNRGVAVLNADRPILVNGNRDTIYQALRNLVENALKFAPENTDVEIILNASGSVTVTDRGPGIPSEQRSQLFQRFWRADRRQSGGAGLGLAIAHRIAVAHAGSLTVADNPDGGSRFTLSIPIATRG